MSGLIKTEIKTEIEGEFYTRMVSENNEDLISEKNSKSLSQSDHDIFLPLRCRLCAIPKNDMVDIFSCNESKEDISVMIKHCLPIVVSIRINHGHKFKTDRCWRSPFVGVLLVIV